MIHKIISNEKQEDRLIIMNVRYAAINDDISYFRTNQTQFRNIERELHLIDKRMRNQKSRAEFSPLES